MLTGGPSDRVGQNIFQESWCKPWENSKTLASEGSPAVPCKNDAEAAARHRTSPPWQRVLLSPAELWNRKFIWLQFWAITCRFRMPVGVLGWPVFMWEEQGNFRSNGVAQNTQPYVQWSHDKDGGRVLYYLKQGLDWITNSIVRGKNPTWEQDHKKERLNIVGIAGRWRV